VRYRYRLPEAFKVVDPAASGRIRQLAAVQVSVLGLVIRGAADVDALVAAARVEAVLALSLTRRLAVNLGTLVNVLTRTTIGRQNVALRASASVGSWLVDAVSNTNVLVFGALVYVDAGPAVRGKSVALKKLIL
jgi:6,7-dimethyl-8-ribityllumazine synthase